MTKFSVNILGVKYIFRKTISHILVKMDRKQEHDGATFTKTRAETTYIQWRLDSK